MKNADRVTPYQNVFFDLDGVLCDPGPAITMSVQHALGRMGITERSQRKLRRFVGPPLQHSFQKYYDFDEIQAEQAVGYYREQFEAEGMGHYRNYEGIPELLTGLRCRGRTLAVVTSKPKMYAVPILAAAGMLDSFAVLGAAPFDRAVLKKVTLAEVLDELSIEDASSVVMVGDRAEDVRAAQACSVDSTGVLYGFGTRQELAQAGATHIVRDVQALGELLLA